jgi:transposase-like protein
MSFVLIIFSDLQRSSIVKMIKFKKMKDMITFTDNKVNYYSVRRNNDLLKYKSKKSIFEVIKV